MNEIAKFFLVPVLKGALIRQVKDTAQGKIPKLEGETPLDCQIVSESPVFQLSDGCHYVDCELSEPAQHTLRHSGKLVGWEELRGVVITLRRYRFRPESQRRRKCVLRVEEIAIMKIEKLYTLGQPQALEQDKVVVQYLELHQQIVEKRLLQRAIDVLPTIDNIIEGPSTNLSAVLNTDSLPEIALQELSEAELNKVLALAPNSHPQAGLKPACKAPHKEDTKDPPKLSGGQSADLLGRTDRVNQGAGLQTEVRPKSQAHHKRELPEPGERNMPFAGALSQEQIVPMEPLNCRVSEFARFTQWHGLQGQTQNVCEMAHSHLHPVAPQGPCVPSVTSNSSQPTQGAEGLEPSLKAKKQETKGLPQ